MCMQRSVVKKIVEANEVNGFGVELAQAQMEDYIAMDKKISRVERDVTAVKKELTSMKKEQKRQGEMLARQGGQIDLIAQYINSPAEEERKNGIIWGELKAMAKNPMGKIMILLAIGCLCMTGQRIMELFGIINS